jgi:hypothetical protein
VQLLSWRQRLLHDLMRQQEWFDPHPPHQPTESARQVPVDEHDTPVIWRRPCSRSERSIASRWKYRLTAKVIQHNERESHDIPCEGRATAGTRSTGAQAASAS